MNITTSKLNSILIGLDNKLKEEGVKPYLNIAIETTIDNNDQSYEYVIISSFNNCEQINEKFKNSGKGKFLILLNSLRNEDFEMLENEYEKVYCISKFVNDKLNKIPSDKKTEWIMINSKFNTFDFIEYDFYDYMVFKLIKSSYTNKVYDTDPLPYGSVLIDEGKQSLIIEKTNCYSKTKDEQRRNECHSETIISKEINNIKDASKYDITFLTTYIPCEKCMDEIISSVKRNNLKISKIQYVINEKESNIIGNHIAKLKRNSIDIKFSKINESKFIVKLLQYSSSYIGICKSFIK